jgi:hypothetical protein
MSPTRHDRSVRFAPVLALVGCDDESSGSLASSGMEQPAVGGETGGGETGGGETGGGETGGGQSYACDDGLPCTTDGFGGCNASTSADSCLTLSACVSDGTPDPGNDCRACVSGASQIAWSSVADGAICDDGDQCTAAANWRTIDLPTGHASTIKDIWASGDVIVMVGHGDAGSGQQAMILWRDPALVVPDVFFGKLLQSVCATARRERRRRLQTTDRSPLHWPARCRPAQWP